MTYKRLRNMPFTVLAASFLTTIYLDVQKPRNRIYLKILLNLI